MDSYSFSAASKLPFGSADRNRLRVLEHKIPPELRGMFEVLVAVNGDAPALMGFKLCPDVPMEAMYILRNENRLGMRLPHTGTRLQENLTFTGERFQTILNTPGTLKLNGNYQNPHQTDPNHFGTYSLPAAMNLPMLPLEERALLRKVSDAIRPELRGTFWCDLERNGGEISISRLTVNPLVTLYQLDHGLFDNIASEHSGVTHPQDGSESTYFHINVTWSLDRSELSKIADRIDVGGHARKAG